MNKSIAIALLATVLLGMGLVVVFHNKGSEQKPAANMTASGTVTDNILPSSPATNTPMSQPAPAERTSAVTPSANGGIPTLGGSSPNQQTAQNMPGGIPAQPGQPMQSTQIGQPAQPAQFGQSGSIAANVPAVPAGNFSTSGTAPQRSPVPVAPAPSPASPAVQASMASMPPTKPQTTPAAGNTATPAAPVAAAKPAANTAPVKENTPAKPVEPAYTGTASIRSIEIKPTGKGVTLRISAENPIQVKYFVLTAPDRMVVDLTGKWNNVKVPAIPANNLVKDARVGRQPTADRLVLDLSSKPQKHELVKIDDHTVEVRLQ